MGRLSFLIKAKFSKLLDRAEDPNETLDYSYDKQVEMLLQVKRGVAEVVTAKKQLEYQADRLDAQAAKLQSQARDALAAQREDLARLALERKSGLQQQSGDLHEQIAALQEKQDKLVASEQAFAERIARFRTEKETMKASYNAASAMVAIGEATTGLGQGMADVGLAIQRARDRTEQMQARAGALDELVTSGALEDFTGDRESALDHELAQLSSKAQVDSDLAKLKVELDAARVRPELPGGS
jgi:phage shock protein A